MAQTDDYELQPAERVVARLRQHARRLLWPSVALILVSGSAAYFGSILRGWIVFPISSAAFLLALFFFLLPLSRWLATRYTVTTRRVVLRSGLLVRERTELLHSRGYEVTLRTSWLQGLFRTGTIIIRTVNLDQMAYLRDVPHAQIVVDALHDLIENSQGPYASARRSEPPFAERSGQGSHDGLA
jgi:membrane protein YdbS with pleckstrin-like domain